MTTLLLAVVVLQDTMSFGTDIDIDDGSFTLVFTYGNLKLELHPSEPIPLEVPIEDKGSIIFGYPQLDLIWNEKAFTFGSDSMGLDGGGALYLTVPMTPELMTSFKAAVDEWNAQYAVYEGLRNI